MLLLVSLLIGQTHPQSNQLYKSENALLYSPGIKIFEFAQIPDYVAGVYSDSWFKQRFPNAKMPRVIRGKFPDKAYSTGNTIGFPPQACNCHVLHEIAHQLTPNADHGPRFARVFVDLVENYMGVQSANALRKEYLDNGVIWLRRPNGK